MLKQNQYILGISWGVHDNSACLLGDGSIIAAAEEERFNREKRTGAFPLQSVKYCLNKAGISLQDVDIIAIPVDAQAYYSNLLELFKLKKMYSRVNQIRYVIENLKKYYVSTKIFRWLGLPIGSKTRFIYFKHHLAHAASAYYSSGYLDAAVIVVDGIGDGDSITIFDGSNGKLNQVFEEKFPNSLGKLYGAICRYLGFWGSSKEGIIMGLAPYGEPALMQEFFKMWRWKHSIYDDLDISYFDFGLTPRHPSYVSDKFIKVLGKPRRNNEPITERHKNIACSLQKFFESSLVNLAKKSKSLTGRKNLCLAGGAMLNCKANSELRKSNLFENIYVPPVPHDAGLSLGAAYLAFGESKNWKVIPKKLKDAYLGPSYTDDDIKEAAQVVQLKMEQIENPQIIAAKMLSEGHIIGWFQGRMEFGPRALGNRSILADPRNYKNRDILNSVIKRREMFRPFAPAVLEDSAPEIFGCNKESPYMLDIYDVNQFWQNRIPAIVHVDRTARIQTVTKESNPLFYELISEFEKITGIPLVLNTSLNRRGEPIVNSPKDAIKTFFDIDLKYMFLGKYLISKILHR